jgi:hypothetical protein
VARIRQKIDRAEWAKLAQDMQGLYVERNGAFFLDSDEAEELRTAFDRQKGDLAEARRRLEAIQDVDPAEYQRLKDAADKAARDKELEAGNFKKLEEQQRATHVAELKKRDDQALALRAQLEESIVDGELVRALSTKYPGAKVTPILLGAKQTVKAMEIGGKLRAVVLDDKGEPRLKAGAKTTDDYMGPTDRIDEMRNDKEWAGNFPATAVAAQQQRHIVSSPARRAQQEEVAQIVQQVRDGKTRIS